MDPEAVLLKRTADPRAPGAPVIKALCNTDAIAIVPQSTLAALDAALAQDLGSEELTVLSYSIEQGLLV